jgi:hypothetical protein
VTDAARPVHRFDRPFQRRVFPIGPVSPISLVLLRVGAAYVEIDFDAGHRRGNSRIGRQRAEPDGAINSHGNAARTVGNPE